MKPFFSVLLFISILLGFGHSPAAEAPPNVVLIFADDLGYGDLGCYGATKLKTPHIDRLAAEGRRFTDAHSASAVCTPSRYALVTGEYPHRKGLSYPVFLKTGLVIDPERQTIADLMKDAGYATACIGKWHLGFGRETPDWNGELKPGPLELGFDYYYGVPVVNSHPPFVYVENHRVVGLVPDDPFVYGKKAKTREFFEKMGMNQIGGADAAHELYDDEAVGTTLAEKSVEWIRERGEEPFFLYLSTTNIHHPFTPAPRFQGTSECGPYGDFVHELDWIVGEVMKTLEEQGVADNTLVIFTSDNGGMFNVGGQNAWDAGHRLNGDLLGFKFGAWEGGHRVPFIARWPGKIEAGSTSNQLISNIDLIATFSAMTGQELEPGQGPDSMNVLPALVANPAEPLRDHLVLSPSKPTHLSVRKGKWMYIGAQGSGGFTGAKRGGHSFGGPAAISYAGYRNSDIENGKIKPDAPAAQLYDLDADPQQTTNLYRERPEVVEELGALLESYAADMPKRRQVQAEAKYDGFKPLGNLRFTFESGTLENWFVVEGEGGPTLSSDVSLPNHKGRPFNREGGFHLTTIAARDGFTDKHRAVFRSPEFVIRGNQASFLASGGFDPETLYVGLVDAETRQVLRSAGGAGGPQMQRTTWDVSEWKGKTVYLEIVDRNVGGWGHLTFDDFSVEGELVGKTPASAIKAKQAVKDKAADGARSPAAGKPNFVIIFTDDQGYGDLGCFGGDHVHTPRIDRMAAEGARLTNFYVAAPVCTPSRAALMTGCYPKRIDMATGSDFMVLLAGDGKGLHPDEVTIAEVLRGAGYRTGMFGKWHLGDQPEFLPTRQGFDEFFGIPYSHDIHPFHPAEKWDFPPLPLLENETVIEMDPDADLLTGRLTERAVEFIRRNSDEPFFVYLPHPIPHRPLHVSPPFMEGVDAEILATLEKEGGRVDYRTRDRLFHEAIAEIDWSVGRILDTLKEEEVDEETLVIFFSDNGPAVGSAGPLKGRKGSTLEGGMREPTVIRWPGRIPAGHENAELMTAMDLLPTLAGLAGAEVPADRVIDGKDVWPVLTGEAKTPHRNFFYHRGNELRAVRSGSWKLHINGDKPVALHDLATDPGEGKDVLAQNREVAKQLLVEAFAFRKEIAETSRPAAFVDDPKPLAK